MYISVDVEADGPIPMKYSMVCFGAVIVEPTLSKTFYGQTRPIASEWIPDALAISGFSREEHKTFDEPEDVMIKFRDWIKENSKGHPIFISDNPAFDWQWTNFYFHFFLGENPFGFSARRIGDLYCGMTGDAYSKWKHIRQEAFEFDGKKYEGFNPTHDPVQDALGNAHALLYMNKIMGLKIGLK